MRTSFMEVNSITIPGTVSEKAVAEPASAHLKDPNNTNNTTTSPPPCLPTKPIDIAQVPSSPSHHLHHLHQKPPKLITTPPQDAPPTPPPQSATPAAILPSSASSSTSSSIPTPVASSSPISPKHGMDDRQQDRLLSFIKDQLRQIQRRFAQRYMPPQGYMTLGDLLVDLNKVIDILWYSFSSSQPSMISSSPPPSASSDESNTSSNDLAAAGYARATLFRQTVCLLSIAESLVTFVDGFTPPPLQSAATADTDSMLRIFHKLDKILARVLASTSSDSEGTGRLERIVELSRTAVAAFLAHAGTATPGTGSGGGSGGMLESELRRSVEVNRIYKHVVAARLTSDLPQVTRPKD